VCDRIALIDRGRLMVYGTVREVRERYSRPEVLVESAAEPPRVPGVDEVVRANGNAWRLKLGAGAVPRDVLAALLASGVAVDRFEPSLAPMDDVFIQVVQQGEA
jgi:ABC-2 type transport system ATP-binding protein